jgi:uncharacterized membrane protein
MIDMKVSKTGHELFELAKEKKIDKLGLSRGLELMRFYPSKSEWKKMISTLLLFGGVAFLITGTIFFFAYNWQELTKYTKFLLIEVALILSTVVVLWKNPVSIIGKACLITSIMLVGVMLAVFGQVYQTGADSYALFVSWAFLISGWVFVSEFLPIWMGYIALINLASSLYWNQMMSDFSFIKFFQILILINIFFLVLFEVLKIKGTHWINGRWFPRVLTAWIYLCFSLGMINLIGEYEFFRDNDLAALLLLLMFVTGLGITFYYYQHIKDITILGFALLSFIIIFTFLMVKLGAGLLFLALIVLVQGGSAGWWLNKLNAEWRRD